MLVDASRCDLCWCPSAEAAARGEATKVSLCGSCARLVSKTINCGDAEARARVWNPPLPAPTPWTEPATLSPDEIQTHLDLGLGAPMAKQDAVAALRNLLFLN